MRRLTAALRGLVPSAARQPLRRAYMRLRHRGHARHCPCCGSSLRRFVPFGHVPRPEAQCPVCHALERHRAVLLFLQRRTDLFRRPHKLLHIAPEPALAPIFARAPGLEYISGDLADPLAMVHVDITALPFATASFDVVYCSHVLEHVEDDRAALAELHRVLRPGGWGVLQVPICAAKTWSDRAIVTPEQRLAAYGHPEHVRCYGPDYLDRLTGAGFAVEVVPFVESLAEEEIRRMGLCRGDDIHLCRKEPAQSSPSRESSA